MTVIAGALSRCASELPRGLRNALVSNLSRQPGEAVEVHGGNRWLLAKIDVGAFKRKGSVSASDGTSLVMAGEPLRPGSTSRRCETRDVDGRALFDDLGDRGQATLRSCAGTFCAAFYSPREHRLTLVSDKLGVRPIYYIVTPEFTAFTSALRVFEAAGLNSFGIDVRGTYETCAFGFPLGTRTCYEQIRTIGPAEIIHITDDAEVHESYFRWDRLGRSECDETELSRQLVTAFESGIGKRLQTDRVTQAFLSGGLDSRVIVAVLRKLAEVHTVNFAPPGSQDRFFATLAAKALESKHYQLDVPLSVASDVYRQEQLGQFVGSPRAPMPRPERPHCIWSGDGGSVGMGHVYLDAETVNTFESGNVEGGIRQFLSYNGLQGASNSAMTKAFREHSRNWHVDGMREQIAALDKTAHDRLPYLFLMFNDQRRHLARHFEDIDLNRFEFHLPFFDADFLETIVRAPVRPFLRHALYHKWLRALSPAAASVPWQTYPDHEPCPIPSASTLRYQWGDYFDRAEGRKLARKLGRQAFHSFLTFRFPDQLISRGTYGLAIVACLLGSNAYRHVVRVGETFVRAWQREPNAKAS